MSDKTFISHVPEIKLSHEFENIDLVSDEDDALVEEKGSQLLRSDRFKKGPGSDISSDGSDFDMADPDKLKELDIAFAEDIDGTVENEKDMFRYKQPANIPVIRRLDYSAGGGIKQLTPPATTTTLTLRHSGMTKSYSSPSLIEVGCFGVKEQDYYSNCTQIVAEARSREMLEDYKGAHRLLKQAVDILISGVQHDPDPARREGVRRRTAEYLQIAENFAAKYTQQKLSKKPTVVALAEIRKYKVVSVSQRIIIVESPKCKTLRVLKSLRKPLHSTVTAQGLIVKCPFMVNLERCCVTDDVVFLLLHKVNGVPLRQYLTRFDKVDALPVKLTRAQDVATVGDKPELKSSKIPANLIKKWATQIVTFLTALHKQGLVYADLNPDNILVDEFSNISITYITQLPGLHHRISTAAIHEMYAAPEVLTGLHSVTPGADWWSLGALIFFLYFGNPLSYFYPYQAIRNGNFKLFVETEHSELLSLLKGLLKHNPRERLGGSCMGPEEIRSHSYFSSVNWECLNKKQ